MSFYTAKVTLSAAVATNGTFTVGYPAGSNPGSFQGARGHYAYAEGLQAIINWPKDFSLSFGASNITVTWLGTTSIPANTSVFFQFETMGANRPGPYDVNGAIGAVPTDIVFVDFGTPIAASFNAVTGTVALADALLHTLAPAYQCDIARNLKCSSSNAGDTTQTLTVYGYDIYGVAMTESFTMNGTSSVVGKKAFWIVTAYQSTALFAGNLNLGIGDLFGLPVYLNTKKMIISEIMDDAAPTAGTVVKADTATPSATTGDVRGTYLPNTVANAGHVYGLLVATPDKLTKMPQF
jgi:hypothetical protein